MRWIQLEFTCIFFRKNKLIHCWFKYSPSICSSRIDHVNFTQFWPSKICVSPTDVISSLFIPQCHLSFGWCCHAIVLCHTFFHKAKTSLLPPLHHLATLHLKALNLHHYHRPPSLDHLTHILYYYKNIISILITFLTTLSLFYLIPS
jgi:hypothetical protein